MQIQRLQRDAEKLALPKDVSPAVALQRELDRTVRNVEALEERLSALVSGELQASEAQLSGLLQLAAFERRHLSELARTGLAAGLEDKHQLLSELQAAVLDRAITGILRELGHDPARDDNVRAVIVKHLRRAVQATKGEAARVIDVQSA